MGSLELQFPSSIWELRGSFLYALEEKVKGLWDWCHSCMGKWTRRLEWAAKWDGVIVLVYMRCWRNSYAVLEPAVENTKCIFCLFRAKFSSWQCSLKENVCVSLFFKIFFSMFFFSWLAPWTVEWQVQTRPIIIRTILFSDGGNHSVQLFVYKIYGGSGCPYN